MNMTAAMIGRVIGEAAPALAGSFFRKLVRTAENEWVLSFKKGADSFHLVITLSAANSRIHLVEAPPGRKTDLGGFGKTLKKTVLGSVLDSISQTPGDRVVHIDFRRRDEKFKLVAELFGPAGALYLLDGEGKTLATGGPGKPRAAPGRPYIPPKAPEDAAMAAGEEETAPERAREAAFPFNAAMEEKYTPLAERERLERARTRALSPLRAGLKKIAKRKKRLLREREGLSRFSDHKRLGDLLQASFHRMKKGEESVTVPDVFSEDGGELIIALDPSLGPAENVRRYYKEYRRYEKGLPRLEGELAALEEQEKRTKEKMRLIENSSDLDYIESTIPAAKGAPRAPGKKGPKGPSGPRRFITSGGFPALVGRSDRENDEITFRVANGRDLWLHARDYPGSHVVVRLPKGADVPPATLREAAMLALRYSKAAKAGKGEVTYCRVKDIRKPKGAPPGKVLVAGAKSVMARIDPEVIQAMKQRAEGPQG
ncbi:MAG: NFACT RNA binding domain-containing protein [Candidatus Nitrospinota bacterium M3_3B_026]